MNSDLIRSRFEKSLSTYNENAAVQKLMAQKLYSLLDEKKYKKIWEIGCGTGVLTEILAKELDFDSYIANDMVEKCKDYIKGISCRVDFIPENLYDLVQKQTGPYNLIISNAVFQWLETPENIIRELIKFLEPGGSLIFSTFGPENFKEIYRTLGKTLNYYTIEDWKDKLGGLIYSIEEDIIELSFENAIDILRHMKYTGVNSIESMPWTKTKMLKFENIYNNCCKGTPLLTYNPIYIHIKNIIK